MGSMAGSESQTIRNHLPFMRIARRTRRETRSYILTSQRKAMNDLNQFHAELPDEQYQEGFKSDKLELIDNDVVLVSDNTEMTPLMVANDFIIKLMSERDEARREAERYRNISCDSQDVADKTLLPWGKQPTRTKI
jgi:hypothetical protein